MRPVPYNQQVSRNVRSNAHQCAPRRAACLAYREKRRVGASDQEAHEAAVAAVQTVMPLPWKEASAEVVNAVAYATRYHSEWFWQGARHAAK